MKKMSDQPSGLPATKTIVTQVQHSLKEYAEKQSNLLPGFSLEQDHAVYLSERGVTYKYAPHLRKKEQ